MTKIGLPKIKNIVVHLGSRLGNDPQFSMVTYALGELLAQSGIGVIYGGAREGLMGILADSVLSHDGEITGVMPEYLEWTNKERMHPGLTERIWVNDMAERKKIMTELSDAAIVLPGGIGTGEELFDYASCTTLRELTKTPFKPIGIININGFYDNLIRQLDVATEAGFISKENRRFIINDEDIISLLLDLNNLIVLRESQSTFV
jgi:uncharacterized protein (TIGR00730 family)